MLVIDNSSDPWFINRIGLKQGNLLPRLFFILVVDTLTRILKTANSEGLLDGIGSYNITGHFHSLHFVDDTLLIYEADKENSNTLKFILYGFELTSGLKINSVKSQLVGLGVSNSLSNIFDKMLGCQVSKLPM